ncbi:MAG TPA: hypothetical protein VKW04_05945 [Planctomycetota bacterium]|nr:hypothetical protein [Planctomycetota bacterium]
MGILFLLGLGFAELGTTAERAADAPGSWFELDGPSIERWIPAWRAAARQGRSGGLLPEPSSPEDAWLPRRCLSYEEEGLSSSPRRISFLLGSGDPGQDPRAPGEGRTPTPEERFRWRETAIPDWFAMRFLLNPLDAVVGLDNIHVSWGKLVSDVSVSTELSRALESLGTPLDRGIFLGVNVDMLGFEEYEGTRMTLIDARRSAPRISFLSTGLGVTFKF